MRIVRVAFLSALLLFSMLPLLDLPLLLRACRIAPVGHDWHDVLSVRGSGQGGTDSMKSIVHMGSVRPNDYSDPLPRLAHARAVPMPPDCWHPAPGRRWKLQDSEKRVQDACIVSGSLSRWC